MNKREAQVERARLQNLLDAYEAGRVEHRTDDEPVKRKANPDRAANVRARIAHLDQVIAQSDDA
jgi:hypothetical protein